MARLGDDLIEELYRRHGRGGARGLPNVMAPSPGVGADPNRAPDAIQGMPVTRPYQGPAAEPDPLDTMFPDVAARTERPYSPAVGSSGVQEQPMRPRAHPAPDEPAPRTDPLPMSGVSRGTTMGAPETAPAAADPLDTMFPDVAARTERPYSPAVGSSGLPMSEVARGTTTGAPETVPRAAPPPSPMGQVFDAPTGVRQAEPPAAPPPSPLDQIFDVPTGRQQAEPPQGGQVSGYTIQAGDTLGGIAQRFGTTVQALAEANGIENPDLIHPGQTLQIPGAAGGQTDTTPPGREPQPAGPVEFTVAWDGSDPQFDTVGAHILDKEGWIDYRDNGRKLWDGRVVEDGVYKDGDGYSTGAGFWSKNREDAVREAAEIEKQLKSGLSPAEILRQRDKFDQHMEPALEGVKAGILKTVGQFVGLASAAWNAGVGWGRKFLRDIAGGKSPQEAANNLLVGSTTVRGEVDAQGRKYINDALFERRLEEMELATGLPRNQFVTLEEANRRHRAGDFEYSGV